MKKIMRCLTAPLAIMLVYGGFVVACPQWTEDIGLDVWNYSECDRNLQANEREITKLNGTSKRIGQRLAMKLIITKEVIDGRMRLVEATEQFYTLNQLDPEIMTQTKSAFPAHSERESVALQVLSFVKAELGSNPSRCQDVSCRLEMELHTIEATSSEIH